MFNTITLNGVDYPFYFGFAADAKLEKALGVSLISGKQSDLVALMTKIDTIIEMAFIGFNEGFRKAKQDKTLTKLEVCDLMDSIGQVEAITMISDAYASFKVPASPEKVGKPKAKAKGAKA